jgi:hypothetical protein
MSQVQQVRHYGCCRKACLTGCVPWLTACLCVRDASPGGQFSKLHKSAQQLILLSLPDAAEGEGGEGAAEGEEDAGDADAAAEGEAGSSSSSGAPPDYANKLLRYVAASPGQDFLKSLHLRRPKRPEDDSSSDAEQKPEPVPVTFRMLDERLPLLEVRQVPACFA